MHGKFTNHGTAAHSRGSRLGLAIGTAAMLTGSVFQPDFARAQAPSAAVTQNEMEFDIPAQGLNGALLAFSERAGLQLIYDVGLVGSLRSAVLNGRFTPQQGLNQLLANTGMTYRFTGTNTVTLARMEEDTRVLGPITVEGRYESAYGPVVGYAASRSASATKTDTPISETPVSVQVIPRDLIEDQGAQNLKDVYENVSGVYQAGNTLNAQTEVLPIIRGFESPLLYRNGMRSSLAGAVDLSNVERVEVLKGPASILYGALDPGGIVNYVTKRPKPVAEYVLQQEAGSYNHLRSTADATGPVTENGALMYRVNFGYTNSDSFRDEIELERVSLSPSLLWKPHPGTELLFETSYLREKQPYDTGVPIGFNNEKLVSDDTFFGDPDLKGRDIEDYATSYRLDHEFDDVFSVGHQFLVHFARADNESIRPRGVAGTAGAEVLRLRYQNEERKDDEYQVVTDVKAKFETGAVDHNVLVGVDLSYARTDFRRFRQNLANVAISNTPNVNFDPPANQVQQVRIASSKRGSLYVQDQVSLLDDGKLKLLMGGRFDALESKQKTDGVNAPEVTDTDFTGRVGALYQLHRNLSVFANYTESFNPQQAGTVDVAGTPLAPETGEQYEAGVKAEFFDGQLITTGSVYQIRKANVAVQDIALFNATGQTAFLPDVEQQSRGVEFDVTGQLTRNLSATAFYSYTDTEVLENPQVTANIGQRLGNVPLQKARMWLKYTFPEGSPLAGLSLSGGARYVSENTAQFDTDVKLGAYTVLDLGAQYTYKLLRFRLNVDNILDKEYFVRASDRGIVHPGEPLSVLGTVSVTF
ncbi:MAG: TonB-dependent receptor [Alphaproteobacteria bacterium]